MIALARLLASRRIAWAVVVVSLLISGVCGVFAFRVKHDDDLLKFLPEDNPDVAAFYEINKHFGSLDVGIVGIETDDPFAPEFLVHLGDVTRQLNEDKTVQFALSLANLQDFTASPEGGIESNLLIPSPPANDEEKRAIRERVMSRDLVVGQLVSADAHAVAIYCFSEFGTDPKDFSARVQEIVRAAFTTEKLYWGGAPFISTYIYSATQDDLRVLTPFAVLVVILMVILSFRDLTGALLSLVSTGMGIVTAVGLMGMLGIDYNLVLSSMPVILFSVGSAYAIHVIARYYQVADSPHALADTLRSVGPTVIAAGMTTVVGLFSYVAMDIEPMRTFGIFSGIGVLWTLILSLTFVPALIVIIRPRRKHFGRSMLTAAIMPVVDFSHRRPRLAAVLLVIVSLVGVRYSLTVDSRMDQSTFFAEGSPPDLADRFLLRRFGGATFIQVAVDGDFTRPEVVRELEGVADQIALLPAVSNVQHIGQVIAQVNQAMEGERRIPDDAEKVTALYRFLTGNHPVSQLITPEHNRALVVIKVRSTDIDQIRATLTSVEEIVARELPNRHRMVAGDDARAKSREYLLGRIRVLLHEAGVSLSHDREAALAARLSEPSRDPSPKKVELALIEFLASDECLVELESDERRSRLAKAAIGLGSDFEDAALTSALSSALAGETIEGEPGEQVGEELIQDLVASMKTPLREIWRRERAADRANELLAGLAVPERTAERIAHLLPLLDDPRALIADPDGETKLTAMVNGLPVLHRGMGVSSTSNQLLSMGMSLILVFLILLVTFRSIVHSLIATAPMLVTLAVVYGGMGWLGVHLDIGTAMLASIVVGAGSDYAVHLLVAWQRTGSLHLAVEEECVAIWTDALMVAAGFYVLTLGEARPLENVGGLTAAAMLVAALSTFISIPLLGGLIKRPGLRPLAEPVTVPKDSEGATS